MTRSDARELAASLADAAVAQIVGAVERERARKRVEACAEHVYHRVLARSGARGFRWLHRILARRAGARCLANRWLPQGGVCPAVARFHELADAPGVLR